MQKSKKCACGGNGVSCCPASYDNAPDLHARLSVLREEYRQRMNAAADKAQAAAAEEDMASTSEHSSESARMGEAFAAVGRALKIVEEFNPI